VAEARQLDEGGVRELVLVAQDTTAYGRDLPAGPGGEGRPARAGPGHGSAAHPGLVSLVRRILRETGVPWIRTLYGYPAALGDDFVELLAEQNPEQGGPGRLCRYLDLPMQHADDRILKAMRRPETGDFLLRKVEHLRRAVPGLTIRSTFIVGFPGETERSFECLLSFLQAARLDHAGFFPYFPEAGTPAADLPDQVPDEVKQERLARAAGLQRRIALERRRGLVGRRLRVMVDGLSRTRRGGRRILARTEGDAPEIDGRVFVALGAGEEPPRPGRFIEVDVVRAAPYDLYARPAGETGDGAGGSP